VIGAASPACVARRLLQVQKGHRRSKTTLAVWSAATEMKIAGIAVIARDRRNRFSDPGDYAAIPCDYGD
jgi:hypothetical protein